MKRNSRFIALAAVALSWLSTAWVQPAGSFRQRIAAIFYGVLAARCG